MKKLSKKLICPICKSKNTEFLTVWKHSGLNNSVFNGDTCFYGCNDCGVVWNNSITDEKSYEFYQNEFFAFENPYYETMIDENIEKYKFYKKMLEESNLQDIPITDIGCGRGNFIVWLKRNGWKSDCVGVDVDIKSLAVNNNESKVTFIESSAKSLPFRDNSCYLLTYLQSLEHIVDINQALSEANRVLQDDGFLLIDVPDAENYINYPAGLAFWFGVREHAYHFSPNSLIKILNRNGFEVKILKQQALPTTGFTFSTLLIIAQKNNKKNNIPEKTNSQNLISSFLLKSYKDVKEKAEEIKSLMETYNKIVFWGISNQLLSVLPHLEENLDKIILCDISKTKQKTTYKGIEIKDPQTCYQEKACLIISSCLHKQVIKKNALDLGWKEEAIFDLI